MPSTVVDPDGPLQLSLRRFADAVHSLSDEVPVWDRGTARWSDSVYARLRGAIAARTVGRRHVLAGPRLPCRIDVLTLVVEVDTAVAGWTPDDKGGTVERLHTLTGRGFRPQDCAVLDGYSGQLERWVLRAAELLGDRPTAVALRLPCPSCGEKWAYRHSGAEVVRAWALKVTETGCECLACRAYWPPDQFEWLARLLGCEPLPS
jgi:hypothetical protein